jgi:hypothetical protein
MIVQEERIFSSSVNARRRHAYLPKQKQEQKHVVRLLLPKRPDGDNVSPSSRDMKNNKKDFISNNRRGRCARIEDD